ncbi:MAG: hypothetical protein EZS28_000240 [Streblomastix strix]|uniref:Uncharacterized protein n=1 Tax=Streblomastix strix TaxID=222440 RepID=A0A5J4XAS2_9EUKA|nr:MAG: hypothetical protein EZS28_000240 [Streblomastix strix]
MNEEDIEASNVNYQKYKKTIEDEGFIEQVYLYRFFAYCYQILPSHKSITVCNDNEELKLLCSKRANRFLTITQNPYYSLHLFIGNTVAVNGARIKTKSVSKAMKCIDCFATQLKTFKLLQREGVSSSVSSLRKLSESDPNVSYSAVTS